MDLMQRIAEELASLERAGNLRVLREVSCEGAYLRCEGSRYLNLSSNDYLGLSGSPFASAPLISDSTSEGEFLHGNPSSRLMTGNSVHYQLLEEEMALLFPAKSALVLGCGYMANSGLMPALAGRDDLIIADKLMHASAIDSLRLSEAPFMRFHHNDVAHLERLLLQHADKKNVWVVIESIYSMDGDLAPLAAIVELKRRYCFYLMVDEAHSFGLLGPQGKGLCAQLGLEDEVDVLMLTYGKAVAGAGACVLCSPLLRAYLVNKMRPLIFSTALPPITLMWNRMVIHEMRTEQLAETEPDCYPRMTDLRARLEANISLFSQLMGIEAQSQIIPLMAGSNERALCMAREGFDSGYWLTAVRPPTVPAGAARIRLSLHAGLTEEQIIELADLCKKLG